jgi:hypothetical protein
MVMKMLTHSHPYVTMVGQLYFVQVPVYDYSQIRIEQERGVSLHPGMCNNKYHNLKH